MCSFKYLISCSSVCLVFCVLSSSLVLQPRLQWVKNLVQPSWIFVLYPVPYLSSLTCPHSNMTTFSFYPVSIDWQIYIYACFCFDSKFSFALGFLYCRAQSWAEAFFQIMSGTILKLFSSAFKIDMPRRCYMSPVTQSLVPISHWLFSWFQHSGRGLGMEWRCLPRDLQTGFKWHNTEWSGHVWWTILLTKANWTCHLPA